MKRKLHLLKTLLVAVGMCAGSMSAWAESYLNTMTGIVGLTDCTSALSTDKSKLVTLAAGEQYVYTFVNHNSGSANFYENWLIQVTGTGYAVFRADGASWGDTYTRTDAANAYQNVTDFANAYNGATVTLTVSRSDDGSGITINHTSDVTTTSDSYYGATYTMTVGASDNITFFISNEKSYQVITNVVYTNASGDKTHYDRKSVDLSAFTGDFCSYDAGVATFSCNTTPEEAKRWCTLDLSSYYSGITGTITNVNLTLTENIQGVVDENTKTNRFGIGVYGDTRAEFGKVSNVDRANSVTWWGITGNNAANRIYYNSTSNNNYVSGLTFNTDAQVVVLMDMINKTFSWIQDNTTKVNNQAFGDAEISQAKYIGVQTWSNPVAANMKDVSLEIVYLEATYYTATFTNTTSGNTVSATIYTDSERTIEIANGLLENGATYYFTATEDGYQNYNGLFTVSGSDPTVDFAMTAKPVYSYTVNAIDGESGIIKAGIASGTCYAGEETTFFIPACVYVGGKLYFTANEDYKKTETISTDGQVISYAYTTNTVEDVVFFVEGEDISGASESTPSANQHLASNGHMGRGTDLTVTNLPTGTYTINVKYCNYNGSAQNLLVKAGEANLINENVSARPTEDADFSLFTSTNITLTATGSSISGVDYIYIVRTGDATVSKTITTAGWATYCSPYILDFSSTIANLDAAYIVTGGSEGVLTKTPVTGAVPAGTGLLLKGSGDVAIPVVATSTFDVTGNKLVGKTAEYNLEANGGYVLMASPSLGFYKNENTFTVGANTAYLPADFDSTGSAPAFFSLEGNTTGINSVKTAAESTANEYYNLAGQRVAQPTKGLYIVNGKKVIVK